MTTVTTHTLTITAACPVDETVTDVYELEVRTFRTIPVEQILEAVKRHTLDAIFQEELTRALWADLAAGCA